MGKAHSNHMADQGSDEYQYETTIKFANTEGRYLYNIEEALRRIEDGSYGKCQDCGKPIALPRLKRLPYTRLCIECKEKEEAQEA
jgi:RNA polymerase-binding protein DksA